MHINTGITALAVLLPSLCHAGVTRLSKRQGTFSDLQVLLEKPQQPAISQVVPSMIRKNAIRKKVSWGPITIAPNKNSQSSWLYSWLLNQLDPEGQAKVYRLGGLCQDCSVLQASSYVTYENGSIVERANGAYSHHALVWDQNKRKKDPFDCGNLVQKIIERDPLPNFFIGSGADTSTHLYVSEDGRSNTGYYLDNRPTDMMTEIEAVNYRNEPQKWYIVIEYEYVPGKAKGFADVQYTTVNTQNCKGFMGAAYSAPTNEKVVRKTSPDFTFTSDGSIMRMAGHLHEGGDHIDLFVNGKLQCDSRAIYNEGHNSTHMADGTNQDIITEMTNCDTIIPVKKGDVLTIRSTYDTTKHQFRKASNGDIVTTMGMFGVAFADGKVEKFSVSDIN